MKYEYKEGKEASGNFEQAMKALFKAPKTASIGAKVKRPKTGAKPSASDKS